MLKIYYNGDKIHSVYLSGKGSLEQLISQIPEPFQGAVREFHKQQDTFPGEVLYGDEELEGVWIMTMEVA